MKVRIATLGAAFSANKGAASMLQALVDNLPGAVGPCTLDVLSTYPDADRLEAPSDLEIVPCTPSGLLLLHFPLAVVAWLAARAGLSPGAFCRTAALRRLSEADLVVDVAGICFVDGRGIPTLVYNTLMTSMPVLLGKPVIKASQALGPFQTTLNGAIARRLLPQLAAVCARGEVTAGHLAELGLQNAELAADLAFRMKPSKAAHQRTQQRLRGLSTGALQRVGLVPSAVVDKYAARQGIDYRGVTTEFTRVLCDRYDAEVLILPHAARPGARGGRMNDLPLCRALHTSVDRPDRCLLVDESLPPAELRSLIASCRVVVAARFHAMVSALATLTPVVVLGWSHKYREVLDQFGLAESAVDYKALSVPGLLDRFQSTWENAETISREIESALPEVVRLAERNFEVIGRTLHELQR